MNSVENQQQPRPAAVPVWTSADAPMAERLTIGLLYLCPALVFLFLQISVFWVFLLYKDFRAHLCYRVMLIISAVDIIQLVAHAYGGLITLFNNSFHRYLEKTMGALLNTMAVASWPLALVLALNRLLVFLPRKISPRKERLLFSWLMVIALAHGLALLPVYLTPFFNFGFRAYVWDYANDDNEEMANNWLWIEEFSETQPLPYLVATFLCYLAIVCIMINERRKISQEVVKRTTAATTILTAKTTTKSNASSSASSRQTASSAQLAPHERRLLLQSVVQFAMELSICSLWFWQMIDPSPSEFHGLTIDVFSNCYWILYNGFKALVYLAINRTIRDRVVSLWLCRTSNAQSSLIPRQFVTRVQQQKRGTSFNAQQQHQQQIRAVAAFNNASSKNNKSNVKRTLSTR